MKAGIIEKKKVHKSQKGTKLILPFLTFKKTRETEKKKTAYGNTCVFTSHRSQTLVYSCTRRPSSSSASVFRSFSDSPSRRRT